MKNRRKNDRNFIIWQYIIGSVIVLVVLTFSFLYILNLSIDPYQSAKVTASKIARQYADLDKVEFGYVKEQPIWEVKSGTIYYNVGFETGTLLSKEGL